MINLPYNATLTSQIMPCQNVPVQTSQNNFQPFQQPQTAAQQMQTSPCTTYSGNPQGVNGQATLYGVYHPDAFGINNPNTSNASATRNTCQPIFHTTPCNAIPMTEAQLTYGTLPQNILDQIRACVSNTAPIFILPSGCHQSTNQQGSTVSGSNHGGPPHWMGQPTTFNYPMAPSICCPPSFYPYPIPMPIYESLGAQTRAKETTRNCVCCQKHVEDVDPKNHRRINCYYSVESDEHRCMETNDDTICTKRNCPSSISLQALVSQLLSAQGIVSCAATRLILRKIPGSNITTTMEDTMDRAQKSISVLTKEQLLAESRNAQQVNAFINLHMTTNPPPNVIPVLTLVQLKVNLLKAQIESLINKKVMESQGYGAEVETSGPIDPTILALKTDSELRQFLIILRQKECDERINANFAPYHSQRVIAESRLSNVQNKLRQVEAEFDRRRSPSLPPPTITSRIVRQFAESYCSYELPPCKLFDTRPPADEFYESPDPFSITSRNPRRLNLKPHVGSPETTYDRSKGTNTSEDVTSPSTDKNDVNTIDGTRKDSKDRCPNTEDCSCGERTSSEESLEEAKKKLRLKIDATGNVRITSDCGLRDVSLMKLARNVIAAVDGKSIREETKAKSEPDVNKIQRASIYIDITPDVESLKLQEISDLNSTLNEKENIDASNVDHSQREKTKWERMEIKDTENQIQSTEVQLKKADTVTPINLEFESRKTDRIYRDTSEKPYARSIERDIKTKSVEDSKLKVEKQDEIIVSNIRNTDRSQLKPMQWETQGSKSTDDTKSTTSERAEYKDSRDVRFDVKEIKVEPDSYKETLTYPAETQAAKYEEMVTDQGESSNVHKSSFQITLKSTKRGKREKKDESLYNNNKNPTSSTNTSNTLNETSQENKESKREYIVSMMTNITYDRQYGKYEKYTKVNDANGARVKSTVNDFKRKGRTCNFINDILKTINEESVLEENNSYSRVLSKNADITSLRINERKRGELKVNIPDETYNEKQENVFAQKTSEREVHGKETFTVDQKNIQRESDMEEVVNKVRNFPITNLNKSWDAYTTRMTEIMKNGLFDQREGTRNATKATCDENNSFDRNVKMEKSFISLLYSAITNNLLCFDSLANNIKSLQNFWHSMYRGVSSNEMTDDISRANIKLGETRKTLAYTHLIDIRNKNKGDESQFSRNMEDCRYIALYSSNTDISYNEEKRFHEVPHRDSLKVPLAKEHNKIRQIRHSVIVDEKNGNYILLRGPINDQRRELSRNGFKRPSRIHRTLIIRSRIKNSKNIDHNRVCPFTLLKRRREDTMCTSQDRTALTLHDNTVYELKRSRKFWSLPKVTMENENRINISKSVSSHEKHNYVSSNKQANENEREVAGKETLLEISEISDTSDAGLVTDSSISSENEILSISQCIS